MGNSPSKNASVNTTVLTTTAAGSALTTTTLTSGEDDEPGSSGSSGSSGFKIKRSSKNSGTNNLKFTTGKSDGGSNRKNNSPVIWAGPESKSTKSLSPRMDSNKNRSSPRIDADNRSSPRIDADNRSSSPSNSLSPTIHPTSNHISDRGESQLIHSLNGFTVSSKGVATISSVKPSSPRVSALEVSSASAMSESSTSKGMKTHRRLESLSLPASAKPVLIEISTSSNSTTSTIDTGSSSSYRTAKSVLMKSSFDDDLDETDSGNGNENGGLSRHSPSTLLNLPNQKSPDSLQPTSSPSLSSSISSVSSTSYASSSSSSASTANTSPPSPTMADIPQPTTPSESSDSGSTIDKPQHQHRHDKPRNPINGYIKRLLAAGVNHRKGTRTFCLSADEIKYVCSVAGDLFLSQPVFLELGTPVKVVGDIHGQYSDLLRIFRLCGMPPKANYLFLGDYVDRGKQSLETILLLLCLKIKHPENVFLLRGNHECASVTKVYGFYDECKRRCSVKVWKSIVDVFNTLPIAATVGGKIFCIHGGLSPHLHSIDDILNISRPTDVPDEGLLSDLLWSDPDPDIYQWSDNDRGVSYCFSKTVLDKFCKKFGFDLVARGHMVVEDGYEFFGHRKLVTVFSAPNYCGEFGNWGAVLSVSKDLLCSFDLLKPLDATGQPMAGLSTSSNKMSSQKRRST